MTIEYDGTGWHGWQSQPGVPTIQESVERALATALRSSVPIVGSGRTDAGVHAVGQVAHFATEVSLDCDRLTGQLNGLLPRSMAIKYIEEVHDAFHARYDATFRTYRYQITTVPEAIHRVSRVFVRPAPDFSRMNLAARSFLGSHDYSGLCRTSTDTPNRVCTVREAAWVQGGEPAQWDFVVRADRFLHGMVRAMVGTLLEIGSGKRPADDIARLLASLDRREAGPAAPASGLVLYQVGYPGDEVRQAGQAWAPAQTAPSTDLST